MGTELNGIKPRFDLQADKGFDSEKQAEITHFEELMGSEFVEVRKKLMSKVLASGGSLSQEKRFDFLEEKTGGRYSEEMFPEAIAKENSDDDEFLEKLSGWCLGMEISKQEGEQKTKSEFQTTIENLPNTKEEWVTAVRKQMIDYLDRGIDPQTLKQKHSNFPFELTQRNALGTMKVDGFEHMPDFDGVKAELMKEVEVVERLGRMAKLWRTYHASLGNLKAALAIPDTDPNCYRVPDTEIQDIVLSKLLGKEGEEGEGAKNVTKAISLYFHIANTAGPDGNGTLLLNSEGLKKLDLNFDDYNNSDLKEKRYIKNIFGKLVSEVEQQEVRKQVATLCGGEYYEAIAMEMACFMGIAARGSDGIVTGLSYMDKMGYMYWPYASNRWVDKEMFPSDPHSSTQWLPTEIRNFLILEKGEQPVIHKGKRLVMENGVKVEREVDVVVSMKLGYDIASMQDMAMDESDPENMGSYIDKNGVRQPAKRNFYIVRDETTGKLLIEKKLFEVMDQEEGKVMLDAEGKEIKRKDTNILMEDILRDGRLGEIDWKKSQLDPLRYFKSREKDALALWEWIKDPLKNEHAAKGDWAEGDFYSYAKLIDDAAPNLNKENQQHIAYLWMYTILYRHTKEYSLSRTTGRSEIVWNREVMKNVVKRMTETGLISKGDNDRLTKIFLLTPQFIRGQLHIRE